MAEDVMQKFLEWLKAQRDDEYATFNEAVRTEGVSESEIDGCMTRAQVYARCADNCRHLLSEASNHKSENREYEMKDIDIVARVLHELTEKHLKSCELADNPLDRKCARAQCGAISEAESEIKKALAKERECGDNPFEMSPDELTTQDMHICDLCGEWVSSPVYPVLLAFNGQSKMATEVCVNCMNHLKFKPTKTVPMEAYRDYEQWVLAHPKKNATANERAIDR